ncbi:MAG: ROK family protein [Acidimicrobiales bacterium]
MAAVVALDIGGSGIRVARVQDGEILCRARLDLIPGTAPAKTADVLRDALNSLEPSPNDGALGVAFPGFLDGAGRVLPGIYLPGFVGMDFVGTLGPLMSGRPMAVVPDVAAAALAEAAATGCGGRLLCVCLGTGANAALVARLPIGGIRPARRAALRHFGRRQAHRFVEVTTGRLSAVPGPNGRSRTWPRSGTDFLG